MSESSVREASDIGQHRGNCDGVEGHVDRLGGTEAGLRTAVGDRVCELRLGCGAPVWVLEHVEVLAMRRRRRDDGWRGWHARASCSLGMPTC